MDRLIFKLKSFFAVFSNFVFLTLVHTGLSVDLQFQACEPKNCGNGPNISYPFWILDDHPDYCGHPRLRIICRNNDPILQTPNNDYIVKDIFYGNRSFRILNSDAIHNSCPAPLHNFTMPRSPFRFGQNIDQLLFFYNCTSPYQDENFTSLVPCNTNSSLYSFAVLSRRRELDYLTSSLTCKVVVGAPIELDGESISGRNYAMFLKKGFSLRWVANNCVDCHQSGGRCGMLKEKFVCFCPDQSHSKHCSNGPETSIGKKARIGVFSAAGVVILGVIFLLVNCRIKKSVNIVLSGETANTRNFEEFIKHQASLAPKRYSFKEIKKMTQSFKNKLGHGGYGSVFKGVLNDGKLVAVKVLSEIKGNGEEFINEVASISRTSHVNIVSLLGYCFEGSKRALIYEFMPNGSLQKYIYDKGSSPEYSNLGWTTLHNISVGIARGLEYLHRGCNTRILHFDIKPHNILLDKDFCPKISDFGLAKLCPRKDSIVSLLGAKGTAGYIAPEVFCRNFGGISHKSDVYSYGMMILEMVGGRKNIAIVVDHTSEIYFPHWIHKRIELNEDLGLHGIVSEAQEDIPRKMILVGLWCIQTNPFDRPAISKVLEMLEGSLEDLEIPPKPYLSSPSRVQEGSSITEILYSA